MLGVPIWDSWTPLLKTTLERIIYKYRHGRAAVNCHRSAASVWEDPFDVGQAELVSNRRPPAATVAKSMQPDDSCRVRALRRHHYGRWRGHVVTYVSSTLEAEDSGIARRRNRRHVRRRNRRRKYNNDEQGNPVSQPRRRVWHRFPN